MVNYSNLLAPLYRVYAVDVTLTPASTGAAAVTLSAIDKTRGVEVSLGRDASIAIPTMRPAAQIRATDLADAGLTRDDLRDATLVMNGKTWRVNRSMPKPTTQGEAEGQLWLILSEVSASV
ncbi:MAG: hypothetical protein K2Y29_00430 [Beijerinckiaceae bacterium]|nr:hypothetical protein [Beijerinckiaceae bacterium]